MTTKNTTITLEKDILKKAKIILTENNQKLSTVLNSLLKKYINENQNE